MTAAALLVDTNVFIDAARGRHAAAAWVVRVTDEGVELIISTVTLAEYASGIAPGMRDRGLDFLASLRAVDVTPRVALRAGSLRHALARRGRTLGLADAMIAASAMEIGVPLVTSNVRDVAIDGLEVVVPTVDRAP